MRSAPIWETMVLDKPVYGAVVLALVGGVVWWVARSRGKDRVAIGALIAGLALAAGVMVVGGMVETDREAASDRTVAFIDAVVREDATAVDGMLAPHAMFWSGGQEARRLPRDVFVRVVGNLDGAIIGNAMSVEGAEVVEEGVVTVRFRCTTDVREGSGFSVRSVWEADWREDLTGRWWVTRMECLWLSGLPADAWEGWAAGFAR